MDQAALTQLLNSASGTDSSGSGISLFNVDSIMEMLAPFMLGLTIVSVLITLLYLSSVISKWRANKAVLDIRKVLVEMNERSKIIANAVAAPEPIATPEQTSSTTEEKSTEGSRQN